MSKLKSIIQYCVKEKGSEKPYWENLYWVDKSNAEQQVEKEKNATGRDLEVVEVLIQQI